MSEVSEPTACVNSIFRPKPMAGFLGGSKKELNKQEGTAANIQ
jgi:hypothetical protein